MSSKREVPFPYNLFNDLGIGNAEMPKDAEATLYYVLYSRCSKREADITMMRYRDDIGIQEIADAYLLTGERIHTIVQSVITRLKKEEILNLLVKGVGMYIAEQQEKFRHIGRGEYSEVIQKEPEHNYEKPAYNDPIEKMDLPERTYNALLDNKKRINGIRQISKVGDIIVIGSKGLTQVEGIGMKSFNIIADVLVRDYGEDRKRWRWRRYYD